MSGALENWAGTHHYGARRLHRPTSLAELREIVAAAERIRVLGSRHSFTGIADSDELVSLEALPTELAIDRAARTVSFGGALTYGQLAGVLAEAGLALANLASLPHISVAGAIATGTHGSGDANRTLAGAVCALELVTSDGALLTARRGEPQFDGLVVGLGALGAVSRITLELEPAYEVRQRVFEGLAWEALIEHFDEITAAGYSVSCFTRWQREIEQVWVKQRVTGDSESAAEELFGASAATVDRHPILGLNPINCTPQLGVPGPWSERLPHFRLGFMPSSGEEIQSEYLVPRASVAPAIDALRGLGPAIGPLVQISEIRTVAADRLWMSPAHNRDAVALHFTWVPEPEAVCRPCRM